MRRRFADSVCKQPILERTKHKERARYVSKEELMKSQGLLTFQLSTIVAAQPLSLAICVLFHAHRVRKFFISGVLIDVNMVHMIEGGQQ